MEGGKLAEIDSLSKCLEPFARSINIKMKKICKKIKAAELLMKIKKTEFIFHKTRCLITQFKSCS